MKITKEIADEIRSSYIDDIVGPNQEYKIIEIDDWFDDGKYSHRYIIFSYKNKLYQLDMTRSGSYFTDYYYDYELDCKEVIKVERTIVQTYYEFV